MVQQTKVDQGIRYVEAIPPNCPPNVTYLLLHGLGGSLEQWCAVIPQLGGSARTIAIDIPGFGQSRTLSGKFDLDTAVNQIIEFCKSQDVTETVLVSHSGGAFVAARLAVVAPELFIRLIIISGTLIRAFDIARKPQLALSNPRLGFLVASHFLAGIFPLHRAVLHLMASSQTLRKAALWPFVARPSEVAPDLLVESLTNSGSISVLHILLNAKSIDHVALMSAITQPVDLIWGSEDRLINSDDILLMRQIAHVVSEHEIKGSGHWPWLENPVELGNIIAALTAGNPTLDKCT